MAENTEGATGPDDDRLVVLVPCLNEENNIIPTVEDIMRVVPTLPMKVGLLLIDDGSTDGTADKMRLLCERYPDHCEMQVNPQNLGLGRTVLNAYEVIPEGTWVTVMPGDNEIVFDSIRNFIDIRHDYDIILGYLQNPIIRPFSRRLMSKAFTTTINFVYSYSYRYLNGVKMYRVECFKGLEVLSSGHAFNAELLGKALLRNAHLRIGEAAFIARGRTHGATKAVQPGAVFNAIREVYVGYRSVARYRRHVTRSGGSYY
ncbi:MAG: hypothetical protein CMH57_02385 [Myxococcales bacterium]|nr:hypothetical protein [Myxococcales bacterium]